jgi:hypothetical protein
MPKKLLLKKPQPKAATIDCSDDLRDAMKRAFDNDGQELLLRVSQYDHSLNPTQYQAIVKFSDANQAWTVGINADPVAAVLEALTKANAVKRQTMHERVGSVSASYKARLLQDAAHTGQPEPSLRPRKVFGKALRKTS